MYQRFQVILIAEDGEYVLSEWQTEEKAIAEVEQIKGEYQDGQTLKIRTFTGGF